MATGYSRDDDKDLKKEFAVYAGKILWNSCLYTVKRVHVGYFGTIDQHILNHRLAGDVPFSAIEAYGYLASLGKFFFNELQLPGIDIDDDPLPLGAYYDVGAAGEHIPAALEADDRPY